MVNFWRIIQSKVRSIPFLCPNSMKTHALPGLEEEQDDDDGDDHVERGEGQLV